MKHGSEITGIVGTVATITLSQANVILSFLCGLCTLIVVAPKAYATVKALAKK